MLEGVICLFLSKSALGDARYFVSRADNYCSMSVFDI